MGGFFGIVSKKDCMLDVYFGVDYHSHLGTSRAGMAAYDPKIGLQRKIHMIDNAPFRSKFKYIFQEMKGQSAIGCISDSMPQPLLLRSHLGTFAICVLGMVNNEEDLITQYLKNNGAYFDAMTGGQVNTTELVAALITQRESFTEGIQFAQEVIDGSASLLILKEDGSLLAARDRLGRLPISIGKNEEGYSVAFESFAYTKLGYEFVRELGPGEIVEIHPEGIRVLAEAGKKMRICSFLWSYYGYPTSSYEGVNVELMRYRNGAIMAKHDRKNGLCDDLDSVGGVPESGIPHALGYAQESGIPYQRAFIKYTPTWQRSFMPPHQEARNRIAKMKQIPVKDLIEGKNLLFVDDSIVRGTQLRETVEFLYSNGAKSVHMRSACPPLMYSCKYLNFSRANNEMELLARKIVHELEGAQGEKHLEEYSDGQSDRGHALRQCICKKLHFSSLEFQTLQGITEAIGLPACSLCTYCWSGKE